MHELSRQRGIPDFMTFSGSASNVSTLAHELGHAFHQEAMLDVRPLNRSYAMNVAETASTFAEMIVADATVQQAETKEEKLVLLEDKVQRSVAFFMNIHARFLFETRFYEERKRGVVPASRLNELMEEAQREAYCNALEEYHPLFWASSFTFTSRRCRFTISLIHSATCFLLAFTRWRLKKKTHSKRSIWRYCEIRLL